MLLAVPTLRIAQHQFTQRVAIVVNQLTRMMIQPLSSAPLKWLKRSNSDGSVLPDSLPLVRHRIYRPQVADPRFGGVRENKAHFRVVPSFRNSSYSL